MNFTAIKVLLLSSALMFFFQTQMLPYTVLFYHQNSIIQFSVNLIFVIIYPEEALLVKASG
jgi:hypothetical protein